MASPLGFLLKGAGFSKAQDDSFAVQDYITSRDALSAIDEKLKVRAEYSSQRIDPISRFGEFLSDDSFESFYKYFQKKLSVQVDSSSSITTLTVRAFTPEKAFEINQKLVDLAEGLVNHLNERGRNDMIRSAVRELREAQDRANVAALSLAAYRKNNSVIDPERQTSIPLQQIARLQEDLISTRGLKHQLEYIAPNNPQIPALLQKINQLEIEIKAETNKNVGGDNSFAAKAPSYQQLLLQKEFADKLLASALTSLEQARNDAQHKQLYIERIVQPNRPDEAMEPKRFKVILAVFLFGLISWGVLSMLIAGIREHQD